MKILVLIAIFLGLGIFFYYNFTLILRSPVINKSPNSTSSKAMEAEIQAEQPAPQEVEQKEKNAAAQDRIAVQLKIFDDYLEYNLVGAQVDCVTLAVYSSSEKLMDAESFRQAFPEDKEVYKDMCRSAYVDVITNQKILVAEPELQSLRVFLSSYTDEVKSFSQYALNDGSQTAYIDESDKKMDSLRTQSREEVLRLKRKYDID